MTRYVAIVGKFTHEGILTALKSRDLLPLQVNLYKVSPKTWEDRIRRIIVLRERKQLAGMILHLPTPMVVEGSKQKYVDHWLTLLDEAKNTKSVAFVYTENLSGRFRSENPATGDPFTDSEYENLIETEDWAQAWVWRYRNVKDAESRSSEIADFLKSMYDRQIEVSPFYRRDDITIKIHDFLDEIDSNIFLRLYVPSSRFQSEQVASLLGTFERYLRQVESRRFSIKERTSGSGTLYLFCNAEDDEPFRNMEEAFERFDQFMKVCRDNPEQAARLLNVAGLSALEIKFLVAKYARDYQRILVDTKHELQQKMLLLSQKFDLDALNFSEERISSPIVGTGPSTLLDLSGNTGSISLSLGTLSLQNAENVSQQIGNVLNSGEAYNENDEQLLSLIARYADRVEAIQLRSDLDQAKASEVPETERRVARGRLSSFLFSLASKASEEVVKHAVPSLLDYILKSAGIQS